MLATRFPTCVGTGVVSTKYRGAMWAQVAPRCRAVTWAATRRRQERICVWQILQPKGVCRTQHALRMRASRLWLDWSLD